MTFRYKRLVPFFLLMFLVFNNINYAVDVKNYISMGSSINYSSTRLFEIANLIAKENSDIVELEILGYSYDNRPIYALRLSEGKNFDYVNKMHILVDGGVHSRETLNPSVVLQTLSDYIKNYRSNGEMKTLLSEYVFHFVPTWNPDGFDIAKFGPSTIKDKNLRDYFVNNVKGDYRRLKANVRGVDINRNYENYTLNLKTGLYVSDATTPKKHAYMNLVPSLEFYGSIMGSEKETLISQNYYLRYDFRVYLSYHSQGRIVYGQSTRFGSDITNLSQSYVDLAVKTTGYGYPGASPIMNPTPWGYANLFVTSFTNKAFLTVETTNKVPSTQEHFNTEYSKYKLYNLPIVLAKKAKEVGYFDYKLYKNGIYVRDAINESHAKGISNKFGYEYRNYVGKPIYLLEEYDYPIVLKTKQDLLDRGFSSGDKVENIRNNKNKDKQ